MASFPFCFCSRQNSCKIFWRVIFFAMGQKMRVRRCFYNIFQTTCQDSLVSHEINLVDCEIDLVGDSQNFLLFCFISNGIKQKILESIAYSKSHQCFINFCFIHKCHINKICLCVYIMYYVFLVMLLKSITYYGWQSESLKVHT